MQFEQSIFRNSSFSKPSNPFVVPKCWPTGKKTSIQWLHEAWTQCNANAKGVIIINTMVFALCSMHNFILQTRYETKRPFGPIFRKCSPDLNKLYEKKFVSCEEERKERKTQFFIRFVSVPNVFYSKPFAWLLTYVRFKFSLIESKCATSVIYTVCKYI